MKFSRTQKFENFCALSLDIKHAYVELSPPDLIFRLNRNYDNQIFILSPSWRKIPKGSQDTSQIQCGLKLYLTLLRCSILQV